MIMNFITMVLSRLPYKPALKGATPTFIYLCCNRLTLTIIDLIGFIQGDDIKKVLDTHLENLNRPNEPHTLTLENHDHLLRTSQPHKKPQGFVRSAFFPRKISPKSAGECDVSMWTCRQRTSVMTLQALMTSYKNIISIYDAIIVTFNFS
jgi:hypothetical protein